VKYSDMIKDERI